MDKSKLKIIKNENNDKCLQLENLNTNLFVLVEIAKHLSCDDIDNWISTQKKFPRLFWKYLFLAKYRDYYDEILMLDVVNPKVNRLLCMLLESQLEYEYHIT